MTIWTLTFQFHVHIDIYDHYGTQAHVHIDIYNHYGTQAPNDYHGQHLNVKAIIGRSQLSDQNIQLIWEN